MICFGKITLLPGLLLLCFVVSHQIGIAAVPGDFDRNGVPDLVWQNNSNRQVFVWYMDGALGNTYVGANYLDPIGQLGWSVVAVADIPGDGILDAVWHQVVWQNDTTRQIYAWYMGGTPLGMTFRGATYLAPTGMPGWTLVGMGDFNRDGTLDLVWQNDTSGAVFVWYMGGTLGSTFLGSSYLTQTGMAGWSVVGVARLQYG